MSQELNLNELEAAARAYPANITRTVCALLDHIRALEAGKVPEGYRLVRAELRDEMIRMAAPRRCKIGSACTDCTCAGSDSEANAPGMVADSAQAARDAVFAELLGAYEAVFRNAYCQLDADDELIARARAAMSTSKEGA